MSRTKGFLTSIFRRGIKRTMMLWGLGLFGLTLALNTFAGSFYTRLQIQRSTEALQTEVANLVARHIQSYISQKFERLRDAAANMSLSPLGSEEQKMIVNLLLKNDQSFEEISVLDNQGQERLRLSDRKVYFPADLRDLRNDIVYENSTEGAGYVSPVFTSDRAEPYLFLALPMTNLMKQRVGVAVAKTSMKFLWDLVRTQRFGRAGSIYLVNERGTLIAHGNPLRVLENPNLKMLPAVAGFLNAHSSTDITVTRGRGLNGEDVLSTYALVPGLGWAVVVEEPVAFALEDFQKLKQFTKLLLAAGLLVGALVIAFLSRRITEPILRLRDGAKVIEQGNLNHRVRIDANDELGELGATFNQMAGALKSSLETLETKVDLRTRELSILYGITTLVNQSLDVEAVFKYGVDRITEIFRFDTIRFLLYDDLLKNLTLSASYNSIQAPANSVGPFRKGEGVVGRVAESGEPVIFEDTQTDPRYLAWSRSKTNHKAGFRFFAAMPIKTNSQVFGVAAFGGKESRRLSDDDVKLLNAICEQFAVALEKSRLFDQITNRSDELLKANKAKDEFLNVMSHELRTPLNVISGYAQVLSEGMFGDANDDQKLAAKKIIHHSGDLLRMINEILQVGGLQSGNVQAYLENIDLNEIIKRLQGTFDALPKKEVLLTWDVSSELPMVATDGDKLTHVLQNLLHNAMKFTDEGRVTLSARCVENYVEFKVKDTGVGIPQEMLPVIFEMFRQVDSTKTRCHSGVGVGLFIVKKFTDILKGKVEVESTPGFGTTFTLTIPVNYFGESVAPTVEQPILQRIPGAPAPDENPITSA